MALEARGRAGRDGAAGHTRKKECRSRPPPRNPETIPVKDLERESHGRPSTHAAILGSIRTRERVRATLARPAMAELDRRPAVFYAGLFLLSHGLTTRFDDIRSLVRLAAAAPG